MKLKKCICFLLAIILCLGILPATVFAEGNDDISVIIVYPGRKEPANFLLPPSTTIDELKSAIEEEYEIDFDDDTGWFLHCGDVGFPNYKLDAEAKTTLEDYNFKDGYSVWVEKPLWEATPENPLYLFGITITGGTGARESYGKWTESDYCWNTYYKYITFSTKSTDYITLSGKAEEGTTLYANTGKNSSGNKDWINLKFDGLDLSNDDSCLGLYPDVWLNIELHGENTMISSGKSGSDYPTIDVAGYLYISGNGSLDVKNTGNYTAIGCKNTQLFTSASIWMYGGKIKAESSGEIPALQVGKEIKLYGGELQAVSKKDVPAIVAENFDISDDMCIAQPAGGIVQKDAYTYTDLYNRQYVLDTIAANSGTAENVVTIKSHIYNQQVVSDNYRAADATCTEPAKYYYSCQCGAKGTETFESGNSTGHDWGEPVYEWSEDGKTCTAVRICKNDSSHTETATASVTGKQTKAPTCTEMGETTYTAVFTEKWAEEKTVTLANIPAVGHTFEWKTDKEATQTEAGSKHEECAVCGYAKEAVSIAPSGAAQTPAEKDASKTSPLTGAESAAVWIFIAAALGLCGTAVYGNKKKKYSK